MLRTRVTELLKIKYPIIQGGMQWIANAELAAAVSNAGGLGIINSGVFADKEYLRAEIKKAKQLTKQPFGVNISLFPTRNPRDNEGFIKVVAEENLNVVETSGRSPEKIIDICKNNNIKVIHKVTAVRHAQKAEEAGCDAVIIDGFECAGHPGENDNTSLILIPLTADAVKIPVIAAGGFGDGRGLMAALALGAEAILMGTRFMMTWESPLHIAFKEHLAINGAETDTALIMRSLKNTSRVLNNDAAKEIVRLETGAGNYENLLHIINGRRGKQIQENADIQGSLLPCGQVIGLIHDISAVHEVIKQIVSDALKIQRKLATIDNAEKHL